MCFLEESACHILHQLYTKLKVLGLLSQMPNTDCENTCSVCDALNVEANLYALWVISRWWCGFLFIFFPQVQDYSNFCIKFWFSNNLVYFFNCIFIAYKLKSTDNCFLYLRLHLSKQRTGVVRRREKVKKATCSRRKRYLNDTNYWTGHQLQFIVSATLFT